MKNIYQLRGSRGGLTYKTWDALTLTDYAEGQRCAQVVEHFYQICDGYADLFGELPRLWVFGYDMDNMKARGLVLGVYAGVCNTSGSASCIFTPD